LFNTTGGKVGARVEGAALKVGLTEGAALGETVGGALSDGAKDGDSEAPMQVGTNDARMAKITIVV
jgi:hypothetical protein